MRIRLYTNLFQRSSNFLSKGFNFTPHRLQLNVLQREYSNWHIVGALCLERKPIIAQSLNPLEQKYFNYLQKVEVEQSLLSEHEKRHLEDLRIAEKLKKGEIEDMDMVSKQTAQDFEDSSVEEVNKFKPSPKITDADEKNDRKSLRRKLDSSLVLAVNQKLGNDNRWILPQAVSQDGETLRQTAERALQEMCSNPIKVQFMGNAPVGYYKYKYPKAIRGDGVYGAKVFFFKAQLLNKNMEFLDVKQTDNVNDHMWLSHKELENVLQPVYGKVIQSFLFPDTLNVEDSESPQTSSTEVEEPSHIKSSATN